MRVMKHPNIISLLVLVLALLCSCNEKQQPYSNAQRGELVISGISVDVQTKASDEAPGAAAGSSAEAPGAASAALDAYTITIKDRDEAVVYSSDWASFVKLGGRLTLLAGNYSLLISSVDGELPLSARNAPVYGIYDSFTIAANQQTELGELVCRLLQCKVTVEYSDDFLSALTGDCKTVLTVAAGSALDFPLAYNEGNPICDNSEGYFAVNDDGSSTMEVVFSGLVNGKKVKMTKMYTGLRATTWRHVKFVNKINDEGNADFIISIDDFVEDKELLSDVLLQESILAPDPEAPKGDGGIQLLSTCEYSLDTPIVVPAAGNPFHLTMKALVPGKVSKFSVMIDSTNPNFVSSVEMINDGSTVLDLVNPSAGAISVFTDILPFPYGDAVRDKEEIDFDLSDAQTPILAFPGNHTFVMQVMDKQGCRKDINVVLVVE